MIIMQHPLPFRSNSFTRKRTEKKFSVVQAPNERITLRQPTKWFQMFPDLNSGTPQKRFLLTGAS